MIGQVRITFCPIFRLDKTSFHQGLSFASLLHISAHPDLHKDPAFRLLGNIKALFFFTIFHNI